MTPPAGPQPDFIAPPGDEDRPEVVVRVLSQPRYLAGVREMMAALAQRLGADELAASQVALAIDEALCNVIRHGYSQRTDGEIEIAVWPAVPGRGADDGPVGASGDGGGARGMYIRIQDRGKQTDPALIRSRELSEIRPGGLGVHIIQEVMDHVRYDHRRGGGMRLTLIKHLAADASSAGADAPNPQTAGGSACSSSDPE